MDAHPNIPSSVWNHLKMLAEHPRIEKMILFGSRAFGDHGERSDIDIAISGAKLTFDDWAFIKDTTYHARSLYWISVVNLERNPEKLRQRVLETGVKIYEKKTA